MPQAHLAIARLPYAAEPLLEFLAARAIPGVERVDVAARTYARVSVVGRAPLFIHAQLRGAALDVRWLGPARSRSKSLAAQLASFATSRMRALFNLDAPADLIDAQLRVDAGLRPLVDATPGIRVPGCVDAWELAARAVLGQQVSVKGATTLSGRLVERFGARLDLPRVFGVRALAELDAPAASGAALTHTFPSAARVGKAKPSAVASIGLPRARAETLIAVARAMERGDVVIERGADVDAAVTALTSLRGIGPWTAKYIALRALGAPDVFMGEDLVIRKALGVATPDAAEARSAAWRPWRSHAMFHVWRSAASGALSALGALTSSDVGNRAVATSKASRNVTRDDSTSAATGAAPARARQRRLSSAGGARR